MSQEFFASSYATGTDSWTHIPYITDALTLLSVVPKESLILDLGCGRGKAVLDLARAGYRVVGVDNSQSAVMAATRSATTLQVPNAKFLVQDAFHTEFPENSFDAITEFGLLQHFSIEERARIIREASRMLKPGGHMLCMMLSRETQQFADFRPVFSVDGDFSRFGLHYHFFTPEEVKNEFQESMDVLTQVVATYQTKAYGADSLSFLFTLLRKPQVGETRSPLQSAIFK